MALQKVCIGFEVKKNYIRAYNVQKKDQDSAPI